MWQNWLIGVSAYLVGVLSGYVLRGILSKTRFDENGGIVLLAVTAIWIISALADIFMTNYQTSPLIHGLMGSIVGFFYKGKKNEDH